VVQFHFLTLPSVTQNIATDAEMPISSVNSRRIERWPRHPQGRCTEGELQDKATAVCGADRDKAKALDLDARKPERVNPAIK
jgi:hypothetical protein